VLSTQAKADNINTISRSTLPATNPTTTFNINATNITTAINNNSNNMTSPSSGGLAVPAKAHKPNEIASSQASYTSVDAEKTDVEQGDITDLEKERHGDSGEKIDLDGDVDIEATAETKETVVAADEAEDDDEYPKGAKLGFIVLALALSIFLMSLDFVRTALATHYYYVLR
jgi:hypothetical protein